MKYFFTEAQIKELSSNNIKQFSYDINEYLNEDCFSYVKECKDSLGNYYQKEDYEEIPQDSDIIEITLDDDVLPELIHGLLQLYKKGETIHETKKEELSEEQKGVYQGKLVPLYKIGRGDVSKYKTFVNSGDKVEHDGKQRIKAKKLNYGHGGSSAKAKGEETMRINRQHDSRRKAFRSRFGCDDPAKKKSAANKTGTGNYKDSKNYWNCRTWEKTPISKLK